MTREITEAEHVENDLAELREASRNRELERETEEKQATWAKLMERVEAMPAAVFYTLPLLNPTYGGPEIKHGIPDSGDPSNPFCLRDASSLDAATRALVDKAWGHTLREAQEKAGVGPEYLAPAVSYDANGGEVDPATVRVLNAAEDRKSDPLQNFIDRRKPVEKPEYDARQHELPISRSPRL